MDNPEGENTVNMMRQLKNLVKQVCPPILINTYRSLRGPHNTGQLWQGIYLGFKDVPVMGPGFEGDIYIQSRVTHTENLKLAAKDFGTIPTGIESRYSLLPFLASTVCASSGSVKILDFGGAMGIAYGHLLSSLVGCQSIDYHLFDNRRCCEAGFAIYGDDSRIHFHTSLSEEIPQVDIVFMSGVLQYIEDYRGVLRHLANFKPNVILITLLPIGDIQRYATAQRNLKGSVMAHWFFNADEIIQIMADIGYSLIFKGSVEDELDMDNFPRNTRISRMANLLFAIRT